MNFRKCAQDNDVPAVADVLKDVRRIVQKLEVSFVEDCDNIFRQARDEIVDPTLRNQNAGWVIWIGDKDDFSFRRSGIEYRFQIGLEIWRRRFDRVRSEKCRD